MITMLFLLLGGSGTIDYLWDNQELSNCIPEAHKQAILISGICAGAVSMANTGLLSGREATCYQVDIQKNELQAKNVQYIEQHVLFPISSRILSSINVNYLATTATTIKKIYKKYFLLF